MNEATQKAMAYKDEVEIGSITLREDVLRLQGNYGIQAFTERITAKTHLVHIRGKREHADLFLHEIYVLNKDYPIKWIPVYYRKWLGKKDFEMVRRNHRDWLCDPNEKETTK